MIRVAQGGIDNLSKTCDKMDIDWPVIEKQLILWADEIPDKYRYLIQQRCLGASSFSKGGGDVSNAGKTAHFKCAIFLTV